MNKVKLLDFITGKKVSEFYKFYKETQWYSESDLKNLQITKLKKLLMHCYNNVPYYRTIIDQNKIDIINFDSLDVLEGFPILTKELIQGNYENFIPTNIGQIKGVKTSQTGGTTGNILLKRNDANSRSSVWGSFKRYEDWMGLQSNKKVLYLMGGHVKKSSLKQDLIARAKRLYRNSDTVDIYNTSDQTFDYVIYLLQKNQYSMIRSYPQFLFSVAKKLDEMGLKFIIDKISTTAEPVMPEHRQLFKKVFGAEVFDQYGCGEIGGIAYECNRHEGLHITEEHVIIEANVQNELIITDLDNYSMPFIRYWNADQAILIDEKCSCGRSSRLIKQIMGRTCDYIVGINGQFLHWAYFWHLIFDSNISVNRKLRKFQIVQKTKNSITIRLVADPLSDVEKEFMINDIVSRLGAIEVNFVYETHIENTKTGKYRPVVNDLIQ